MNTIWKKLTEHNYEVYTEDPKHNFPVGCVHVVNGKWSLDAYFTVIPELKFEIRKTFDSWHEAGIHLAKLWRSGREYSSDIYEEYDEFDTYY